MPGDTRRRHKRWSPPPRSSSETRRPRRRGPPGGEEPSQFPRAATEVNDVEAPDVRQPPAQRRLLERAVETGVRLAQLAVCREEAPLVIDVWRLMPGNQRPDGPDRRPLHQAPY